ncbi:uncharacterized protein N7484_010149 [Penicillium longicatenatum]|uniref:uncharacterized protein n=1 Tax=Penicillium longicatenatum TaxID=1561947 RepID=UPI0025471691|nr:uncharacterized protein N7484_010149 [Penicillium longicatenatum]KAJ5636836.1 hypothetical protein N7484_010149 [Penicillium longicatenatum]
MTNWDEKRTSWPYVQVCRKRLELPLLCAASHNSERTERLTCHLPYSIKKPKTNRYPSLRGVDAKFRRNHRHALHGTAKALKERKEGKREVA